MKKIILIIVVVIVVIALVWFLGNDTAEAPSEVNEAAQTEPNQEQVEQAIENLENAASTLTEADVQENIVGLWRSLNDSNYRVDFSSNGTMVETYDGGSRTDGTWAIVDFNDGPSNVVGDGAFGSQGVFLRQSLDEGKSHFYYKVVQVTDSRLVTIYLNGNGVLSFERVQ